MSAVSDEQCITVSGRPDILSSFAATLPETVSVIETSIGALYHSPTHNNSIREEVLADLQRRKIRFPTFGDIICPIRSTFTGEVLDANDNEPLVNSIVDTILVHQVNWDKVTSGVAESIPENETAHLVNVDPGSGLMRSMEKAFRNGGLVTHNVVFDDAKAKKTRILEPIQECVAVVGMAVNVPGASNSSKLWEILQKGVNTVAEVQFILSSLYARQGRLISIQVPENRFRVGDYTTGPSGRSMKAHTGNFLDHVDKFDHEFFNISPREARSMDPQIRILLHAAYEALEDSGYVPNASKSFNPATFGCYVGAATGDYVLNLRNNIDVYYSTGKGHPSSRALKLILVVINRESTLLPEWAYFVCDGFRRTLSSCRHSLLIIHGGYLPSVPRIVEGRLQRRFGWRSQSDFKPRREYIPFETSALMIDLLLDVHRPGP